MTRIRLFGLICLALYISFCAFQYSYDPVKVTKEIFYIVDNKKNTERLVIEPIHLHSGDSIKIIFDSERYFNGTSNIERVIEDSNGNETVIESIVRRVVKGKYSVVAIYKIPTNLPYGCGYKVYSRIDVSYDYNLLTLFINKVQTFPKIALCIDKDGS